MIVEVRGRRMVSYSLLFMHTRYFISRYVCFSLSLHVTGYAVAIVQYMQACGVSSRPAHSATQRTQVVGQYRCRYNLCTSICVTRPNSGDNRVRATMTWGHCSALHRFGLSICNARCVALATDVLTCLGRRSPLEAACSRAASVAAASHSPTLLSQPSPAASPISAAPSQPAAPTAD